MALVGEKYEIMNELGSGTYGTVFSVNFKEQGWTLAKKVIDLKQDLLLDSSTIVEISILTRLYGHPSIIRCHWVNYDKRQASLFLSLAECDLFSLADTMDFPKRIALVPALIKGIGDGLHALQTLGFSHNDLKPGNILWKDQTFKLCDFGLSGPLLRVINTGNPGGTLWYRGPESLGMANITNHYKLDIWSLGLCVLFLISNGDVIRGRQEADCLSEIYRLSTGQLNLPDFQTKVRNGTITGSLDLKKILRDEMLLSNELVEQSLTVLQPWLGIFSLNPKDRPQAQILTDVTEVKLDYPTIIVPQPEAWLLLSCFRQDSLIILTAFELFCRTYPNGSMTDLLVIFYIVEIYFHNRDPEDSWKHQLCGMTRGAWRIRVLKTFRDLNGKIFNPILEGIVVPNPQMLPWVDCPGPDLRSWFLDWDPQKINDNRVQRLYRYPKSTLDPEQRRKILLWSLGILQFRVYDRAWNLAVIFFDMVIAENPGDLKEIFFACFQVANCFSHPDHVCYDLLIDDDINDREFIRDCRQKIIDQILPILPEIAPAVDLFPNSTILGKSLLLLATIEGLVAGRSTRIITATVHWLATDLVGSPELILDCTLEDIRELRYQLVATGRVGTDLPDCILKTKSMVKDESRGDDSLAK